MRPSALSAFVCAFVWSSPALAVPFDVTLTGTTSAPIFGAPAGTSVSVVVHIDPDVSPPIVLPAGTGGYTTALYGYTIASITPDPVTIGSASFVRSEVVPRIPVAGSSADIWFDAPLTDGGTPNSWVFFSNAVGFLQFGSTNCGVTCALGTSGRIDSRVPFATVPLPTSTLVQQAGPSISVPYAVPGDRTLVTVSGLAPGDRALVGWAYATGSGPCLAGLGGLCVNLLGGTAFGSATANTRGDAWVIATVPTSIPLGATVYFQAIVPAGAASAKSNVASVVAAP